MEMTKTKLVRLLATGVIALAGGLIATAGIAGAQSVPVQPPATNPPANPAQPPQSPIEPPSSSAQTTLTAIAQANATEVAVAGTAGFAVGDDVTLNPGGANQETNTIAGFASIIFARPLRFAHYPGETIVKVQATGQPPVTSLLPTAGTGSGSGRTASVALVALAMALATAGVATWRLGRRVR